MIRAILILVLGLFLAVQLWRAYPVGTTVGLVVLLHSLTQGEL